MFQTAKVNTNECRMERVSVFKCPQVSVSEMKWIARSLDKRPAGSSLCNCDERGVNESEIMKRQKENKRMKNEFIINNSPLESIKNTTRWRKYRVRSEKSLKVGTSSNQSKFNFPPHPQLSCDAQITSLSFSTFLRPSISISCLPIRSCCFTLWNGTESSYKWVVSSKSCRKTGDKSWKYVADESNVRRGAVS